MATTIKWTGVDNLRKQLSAEAAAKMNATLKQGLFEEAQIVFRNSQRLVPVDSGTLRRSGILFPPKQEGNQIIVEMGYGGAASAYAMRQHEEQSFKHKSGKSWKYLEIPVREAIPKIQESLKVRLERLGRQ